MGRIAIVTGGSRGIGAATARLAARDGYDVCLSYVSNKSRADDVVAACVAQGRRAVAVQADVADPAQVEKLFAACDTQLGPVSLLVNNAGIIGAATLVADLTDEVLARTFAVNVYGSFYCARAAIPRMSTQAGGAGGVIVNLSSVAARLGSPNEYVHYAASKGAIETFTVGLAKELGPLGIRVNAVQAGTTDTEIHAEAGNPERPKRIAGITPLGRVATAAEMAEAILSLASDRAGFTTGAILGVTGGL